ncbi:PaaI family thioesterase [Niveispirillum sp. KHB5.9]|uniref:PaaI family thioesterase n=1 Tax=Niveispirillum sp. KHB5.9 TaxID=3400269 RepID=UPI003A8664A2
MGALENWQYGLATPEQVVGLTGREVLERIIDGRLPQPPIARTMHFWLAEVGEGRAAFVGEPGMHMANPFGMVHGGWALTLIDSAAGCAAQSVLPAGLGYATVETKGNFTRPIPVMAGPVRAEAWVVSQGRQIITTEARVLSADGKVLAHGTSTLIVLGPK